MLRELIHPLAVSLPTCDFCCSSAILFCSLVNSFAHLRLDLSCPAEASHIRNTSCSFPASLQHKWVIRCASLSHSRPHWIFRGFIGAFSDLIRSFNWLTCFPYRLIGTTLICIDAFDTSSPSTHRDLPVAFVHWGISGSFSASLSLSWLHWRTKRSYSLICGFACTFVLPPNNPWG